MYGAKKRIRMCESCHSLPSLCGTQCERWPQSDYYLFTTSKHYSGKPAEAEELRKGNLPARANMFRRVYLREMFQFRGG